MTRAAIYFNPEAYGTAGPTLMGRHAAGEGFLQGLIRHGAPGELALWNYTGLSGETFARAAGDICGAQRAIRSIDRHDRRALSEVGLVSIPTPVLAKHAWNRRNLGDAAYSLCGVTHTTVSVLDSLAELCLAPVQPWDAVVVTSRSVRASLEVMFDTMRTHLAERFGASRMPLPQFPVIPLGVDPSRFETSAQARREWRDRLGIEEDDVVALYVGRFNHTSKMSPTVMAAALERAARATDKRVHWVLSGWAAESQDLVFKQSILAQTLSLQVHFVDGRPPATRSSIWSVADLFISLSDNVQETFGLTPVEAMAAGLPSVISDWDGYRDTVRDGVDGFRIRTVMPSPGLGRDLALNFAQGWLTYEAYVASVSQFTAIDPDAATRALKTLIDSPDLRARMGAAARARARAVFDWKHIIPQYESLWSELNARRQTDAPSVQRSRNGAENPWRPDPFRMYAGYASEQATGSTMVAPAPGIDWAAARSLMGRPLVRQAPEVLPPAEEVRAILAALAETSSLPLRELLDRFPPPRRPHLERGVVWMAKYGLLVLEGATAPPSS